MKIIFTDYKENEFENLSSLRVLKCAAGFILLLATLFFLYLFVCKSEIIGLIATIISLVSVSYLCKSLDKNDSAKYTYAYSLYTNGKSNIESQECDQQSSQLIIANGKNNIKSQEYDPESSELIITYNKKSEESEETKSYVNLRNMVVKFDDTITEPVINFDTNEITKPRIIIEN